MNLKCLHTFVTVFLLPLGVSKNAKYDFIFFIVCYSLVFYLTFGVVIGLVNTTDIGGIGLQIGQLTTYLTSLAMTLYYKFSINLVLKLISKLKANGYQWMEAGRRMEEFIGSTVLKVFCGYYAMIFAVILPILLSIPNTSRIDEKTSFLIPFWYYCGDADDPKWTSWLCWKVEDVGELWISDIVQSVLYTLTLHALVMYLLFYTILTTNVRIHAEVLNENVVEMARQWDRFGLRIARDVEDANSERSRQMARYYCGKCWIRFDDIVKHQQFIRDFTKDVTKLLQWMVMINMMGIFVSLTITLFFTIVEKTNDSMLSSKMASMSFIMIITFFIYCYNAQTITDLNQSIFDSVLKIPWYDQSISFRKKYTIVLSLNQKPIHVKACKMYEVNLPLFLSFMKAIYSVINIMLLKYS
ncbi:uncharacterized protein LOC135848657 [Planococcus citri]|uniref:uncharacterized protein LOC135848657 n=1 Tax=Planococcus citri TaxID=170843 RepID=UPI0031F9BFF3